MSNIAAIIEEYVHLRETGMESKSVLQQLRSHIGQLSQEQRDDLVRQLRWWEEQTRQASQPVDVGERPTEPQRPAVVKPLSPRENQVIRKITPPPDTMLINCPQCGKSNQKQDIFCYACGQVLEPTRSQFDTRAFNDMEQMSDEFFGPDSVLVLVMPDSQQTCRVNPQRFRHEIVLGRSGGTMRPDIDLTDHNAAGLGVSRLHISLRYDSRHNTISASDMGSANGSFINGQRLHPNEIRVLRNGDTLRIGRMNVKVYFQHTTPTPNTN